MEILLVTVRDEIASCIEKAYPNMSTCEVQRLLHLSSDKELQVNEVKFIPFFLNYNLVVFVEAQLGL
jgi:hypothetical protein